MKKQLCALSAILTLGISCTFADYNKLNVPDSAEIRRACAENWFYGDLSDLREKRSELRTNNIGQEFQIRLEETDSSFAVIIAPQMKLDVDFYTENGVEQRTVDEYPADARGSWLLIRNTVTGKPEKIRVFFSNNSDMYIQFSPDSSSAGSGNKVYADFVIAGLYAGRGIPVGIPFEKLYTASFQELYSLTETSLPWKYADTQSGQFTSKLQMIGVIRKNLSRIVYTPDACYNENGELVEVSTGKAKTIEVERGGVEASEGDSKNNIQPAKLFMDQFGFAKWIVDGLVEPVAGSHLYRNPLLVKTVEYNELGLNGVLSQTQELSFALDWCRNLAAACMSIRMHRNYLWNESGTDVKIEPFSSEVAASGITQTTGYLKNSGYEAAKLKPILYVLASSEPAYCYLAAIKRPVKNQNGQGYYCFDRCAVIFPLFDKNGQFNCVIFDNGEELNLSQFTQRYKGAFIHLSRLLSQDRFFPD